MTPTAGEAKQLVEPTVLGAMRRHWLLACLVVVACVDLALAYGALTEDEYRATATVSAPRPAGSALQSDAQYLDSQVLLLNSGRVGDRALEIAQAQPGGAEIDRTELAPTIGAVEIIPPQPGSSGSYGTTIVDIQFTAPSAEEAQVGANALATAYDEVRSQQIADSAAARITSIERAIANADSPNEVSSLREERVQALIDQGRDLAQTASVSTAEEPEGPATPGPLSLAATGLLIGVVLGAIAAFARAVYLKHVGEARVAERVYGAPMLIERPSVDHSSASLEITESDRLLAKMVAHRLTTVQDAVAVAVVAAPRTAGRSGTTAALALALAEDGVPVLAVDGDNGALTELLDPGAPVPLDRPVSTGSAPLVSRLHASLSVLDAHRHGSEDWDHGLIAAQGQVVVVDCPAPSTSARAVDLLARCHAVVVLVRADDSVQDHVEVARWLDVTGVEVLGYTFTPHGRRGPRAWWPGRQDRARADARRSPQPAPQSIAEPVPETGQQLRSWPAPQRSSRHVGERSV